MTPPKTDKRTGPVLAAAEQLALSIDRMPLGYIVWDENLRVLEWNPAAEKIFGWTAGEAKGKEASKLMLPGAESPPDCMRRVLQQSGQTVLTVCAGVNKNGKRIVCEWHNTAVRDDAGKLRGVLSMLQEITDRDQTDRELRESRKFLQTIIETEPECVKLIAADGTLIMMNRAGLDMLEAGPLEEVKGQSVCPMVSVEQRDAFNELTAKVFQGESGTLEFEMTGIHGRKLWLETHAVPLRNDRDEIIALLGITRDITHRREAEQALRKERDLIAAVLDTVAAMVLVLDKTGKIVRFNRTCEKVSGYSAREMVGKSVWDFLVPPEQAEAVKKVFQDLTAGSFPNSYENAWVAKNGQRRLIAWSNTVLLDADGSIEFIIPTGIDITERKRLEDQFLQSQKMESIGTLAGGMAHDFNNILTAIIGYGSLLQMKLPEGDPLRYNVDQILSSANRAALLTQGLLAYSRKQLLNPQPVNVDSIVKKVELLLTRLIGEDIELKIMPAGEAVTVMADTGQIEQVLMNLATNARDAMPGGGHLFIEIERFEFDATAAAVVDLGKPGPYVLITVTDSGTGMDEKVRQRIFEPFFTTKEAGKGTGLGLATAYGIVKQHNGTITVDSEEGRGTTFKVYLPIVTAAVEQASPVGPVPVHGRGETVLVAEDDEVVRQLTSQVLEQFGYTVIQASDGEDAVNKYMENRDRIKLLLLDVLMPKKNGGEVYTKIKIFSPAVKALFMSGYTADFVDAKGLLEKGANFIMKPAPVEELLKKIRETLDNG